MQPGGMTETDTRNRLSFVFGTAAALVPVALLGVISLGGTFTPPHGFAIAAYAIPTVLFGAVLAVGARLLGND